MQAGLCEPIYPSELEVDDGDLHPADTPFTRGNAT
jgi:hypothetical protein